MRQEYSFGAVIYRYVGGRLEYLLEKMTLGHIAMPKGHIEKNETKEETVLREIKEELNLEVELDTSFEKTINYSPCDGVTKDVTYFLATIKSGEIITQKEEVMDAFFKPYIEAIELISFENDKEVLKEANVFLKEIL